MYSFKKICVVVASLLLATTSLFAQQNDYDSFFRGKNASSYTYRFNGNFFWDNREYDEGEAWVDGKLYTGLLLNINAHHGTLLLKRQGDVLATEINHEDVAWFRIGDRLFVNLGAQGVEGADNAFYELLLDCGSEVLFEKIEKQLKHDTRDANGDAIGYYDPHYDARLARYFEKVSILYILHDGVLYPVKNRKDFKNIYKARIKEVRRAARILELNLPGVSIKSYSAGILAEMFNELNQGSPFEGNIARVQGEQASQWIDNSPIVNLPSSGSLPAGWFSPKTGDDGVVEYVSGSVIVATLQNKMYEVGDKNVPTKGPAVISGYVYNDNTGDTIPGAVISDSNQGVYATTDKSGFYSIEILPGENTLNFSEYMMEDFHVMVNVYAGARLDVRMNEKSELLESALVSADARANHRTTKMGLEKLSIKSIRTMPASFGEGDVLKAVQSLPGVQSVGEASSGINVRGGSVDQNLILFNGGTIFNPSHMFGIFSSFNPDIVEGVELYKSSIPAEHGGRISSVLDVTSREGNMQKFKGSVGLGLVTSHIMLEGPIKKDKTSLIFGGRTTYSNWMLGLLPENSGYAGGSANFTDLNAGLTHKFNETSTLNANVYWSADKFAFSGDTLFNYSTISSSVVWKKLLSDKAALKVVGGYDQYGSTLTSTGNEYDSYSYNSIIRQGNLKGLFSFTLGNHAISSGAHGIVYFMSPGSMKAIGENSQVLTRSLENETALEASAWLADAWNSGPFSLELGGRLASFIPFSGGTPYVHPEARVSAKYSPNVNLSFKAGFNSTTQFIHLLSNTASVSPVDTWKLSDANIKPQTGWQAACGAYWTVWDGKVDLSAEGYWKRSYNYLDYKSGATLVMNENLADDLIETTGKSYGVELQVKKTTGKLTGSLSYTWSRAMLMDPSGQIDGGRWYNAPFDKPHNLKFESLWAITRRYSFSCNVDYSTGRPVTIPTGRYYYGGSYRLAYSYRNEYRIPDYFRMDLAFNIDPGFKLTKLTHFTWTMGVYNVTGRKNAYSVYYTTTESGVKAYKLCVFATQIPYLSVNMKF